MLRLTLLAANTLLASTLCAQSTIVVGSGGTAPEIRDALAQASTGDVLLVLPGTYAHFTADVAVTIRAAIPGTVDVVFDTAYLPTGCGLTCHLDQATKLAPPENQSLHIVGLSFVGNTWSFSTYTLSHYVRVDGGHVTFDECQLGATNQHALWANCQTLHLHGCVAKSFGAASGAPAIFMYGGDLNVSNSYLRGGNGPGMYPGDEPGYAIDMQSGRLHATMVHAIGGNGSSLNEGSPAIRPHYTGAWISDSVIQGGNSACAFPFADTNLFVDRSQVIDQPGSGCWTSPTQRFVLAITQQAPPQRGATYQVNCSAQPFGVVGLFYSLGLGKQSVQPLLDHPVWLDIGQAQSAALLLADANGNASASWLLPTGTALLDQDIWFQAFGGPPIPAPWPDLRSSGVVGGLIR